MIILSTINVYVIVNLWKAKKERVRQIVTIERKRTMEVEFGGVTQDNVEQVSHIYVYYLILYTLDHLNIRYNHSFLSNVEFIFWMDIMMIL